MCVLPIHEDHPFLRSLLVASFCEFALPPLLLTHLEGVRAPASYIEAVGVALRREEDVVVGGLYQRSEGQAKFYSSRTLVYPRPPEVLKPTLWALQCVQ